MLELARWMHGSSRCYDLCMAGGVALNCVMNARLRDRGPFRRIWVQPAAGDAGTALGALRRGVKAIRVAGPPEVRAKLAALAQTYGARLDEDDRPGLYLLAGLVEQADLAARCRDWLQD